MVKENLNDIIASVCAVENECNYESNPLNLLHLTYIRTGIHSIISDYIKYVTYKNDRNTYKQNIE